MTTLFPPNLKRPPAISRKRSSCRGTSSIRCCLPKVLDEILTRGGGFVIKEIRVGQKQTDASFARLEVRAASAQILEDILDAIHDHGAVPVSVGDCVCQAADMDGAFPEAFTAPPTIARRSASPTIGSRCRIRKWIAASRSTLCQGRGRAKARCIAMTHVRKGDAIVVGRQGLRVFPADLAARQSLFEFMASPVSSEKPKGTTVREIAATMRRTRAAGEKILAVLGPAVVHTGSVDAHLRADSHEVPRRAVCRQRPGHARHRTGLFRHQPGHLSRTRLAGRRGTRASLAGHQHHSPAGRHSGRRRQGHSQERHHVRMRAQQDPLCPGRQHSR